MEPVELTLARYRTADLRRDARTYRVAAEARRLLHRLAPASQGSASQVCCA